jgi:hypothetical protein
MRRGARFFCPTIRERERERERGERNEDRERKRRAFPANPQLKIR